MRRDVDRVVLEHDAVIQRWVARRVRNAQDAEDLSHDIVCAIIEGWPRFRGESSVRTWVYAVCRNQLFKYYRGSRRSNIPIDRSAVDQGSYMNEASQVDRRTEALMVQIAVESLPVRCQNLYRMRYCAGMSIEEIAAATGVPAGTVKYQFHQIRSRLQQILD